ncbi:glycosyltransferase family 2 protein [Methanocella sp. MCL-LM]|uniref:glycosyltransferase family 2 protein n=1 Tax=Methanocella sp. MCL-LM TaxID=3412035 RepID=UPI003C74504A
MAGISACIVVRNEEKFVRRCLENIKGVVDEIVVVDGQSTDSTVEICRQYTDRIFFRKPQGFANPDYQFAIEQATQEWVLVIDADELLSDEILASLRDLASTDVYAAYAFPRRNYYDQAGLKWTSHVAYPDYQVRFSRQDSILYTGQIHETPQVKGKTKFLDDKYYMIHLVPGSYEFKDFKSHYIRFAKIQARQEGLSRSRPMYFLKAFSDFVWTLNENLIRKKGYKDGAAGLCATFMFASYNFLVSWYKATGQSAK